MGRIVRAGLVLAALAAVAPAVEAATATAPDLSGRPRAELLLGAEDNRLIAYDPATGASAVALGSAADDPVHGLDLNGQICADPRNPGYFIAGEDTNQDSGEPGFEPGWGYLRLRGTSLHDLQVTLEGNLVPTYANVTDNPENYGCGFLSDGRLVTTDVGDQQPFAASTGQLIVWFRRAGSFEGTGFDHCKVDVDIPTAGGVHVGPDDSVYVAANRPGAPDNGDLAGVYRYHGLPVSMDQCTRTDATGAPLVDEGVVTSERFITGEPVGALTPSAIAAKPGGGFYVSSVATGVIAEYTAGGRFVRRVLEPPAATPVPPYPGGTPFGIAVDRAGALWYADIGVELTLPSPGPGDHNGSVRRIELVDGEPAAPVTVRDGLQYPDGLGLVPLVDARPGRPTDPRASSAWGCGSWGMYGATVARTFSTECPSAISPATAPTLVQAWSTRLPSTVTASPAVVDGSVYVGDWSGTMYALRLSDGGERWRFQTESAPGAAFGPIVSSAAVADVVLRPGAPSGNPPAVGGAAATRRLVIFGAGPRLYALDAVDGSQVWVLDRSMGIADTPVEIESSPVVHGGVVYVGLDTHTRPSSATGGVRGGLLAVDAATGAILWQFHPELDQPGQGCGSVWSSPTIDVVQGTVLLATANCTAEPDEFTWNAHTEAVTALDLDDGEVRWTFQPHEPNRADHDFGATPNLITVPGTGARLVGIGNKDAVYYALDPATGGLVWSRQVAEPGDVDEDFSIGGFIGSTATWRGDVYGGTALGGPPWYHALTSDGASKWTGVAGPTYAGSAVVHGVVFAGDLSGVFRAFDAETGAVLFSFPLLGPISSAPAIAGDTVVLGSGTSSSDACAKDAPGSDVCAEAFERTFGSLGTVTAFRPLTVGAVLPVP